VLLLKKVWPNLGIHSLEWVGRDPAIMGMLKNAASGVLIARRAQRTPVYASPSSLLAALLDGLFEQSPLFLSF
jgi:hypothetical protein